MEKEWNSKGKKATLENKALIICCELWILLISCQDFVFVVVIFTHKGVALKINSWNNLTENLDPEISAVSYKRG